MISRRVPFVPAAIKPARARIAVCYTTTTRVLTATVALIFAFVFHAGQAAAQPSAPLPPDTVLSVALPSAAPADARLTLQQAVQTGLKNNPQTTAARYNVESAHENYNSQKSPINPTINMAALNNTVAPLNGLADGSNYSAYATLETNGAQHFRASQSREQFHQAQADAHTTNTTLKLNIITAFVNLQVTNRSLEVEQKVFDNMRQLSELTRQRFEAGAGPQADAIRARITYVQEQQNMIADVAAVNSARAALNAQLGRPTGAPIDAAAPLEYKPVPLPAVEAVMRYAERNRPEIQSAEANLKSLRAATGLARSAYYPDVIVGKDFTGSGEVSVGLAVPVDLGSIKGAVKKARADVKAQEAQVEVARQAVDLDVNSAHIGLAAAGSQMQTYDTGILTQSESLYNQMRQSYVLGANSLVDVITAENTYRAVQSAYYTAAGQYVLALYTLEHAAGAAPNAAPGATLDQIGR